MEKFIGDAVMAVFGIPVVHEDDALRAVRAAAELRSAITSLNEGLQRDYGVALQARIGVNTGEVVAGTAERLATGDAVNLAARLEQAAAPGEILIGETTRLLARAAIEAEPLSPIEAKGKAEPLRAFRLIAVKADAPGFDRHFGSPFVGRKRELGLLTQALDRAVSGRSCHLFTVLGSAGVGKSRLVLEALDEIAPGALVLTGRSLPYGEGITFWPLQEMLQQLPAEAAEPVAERMRGAGAPEELFSAVRKLLARLAQERPLVVVLDDLHWAEPTFSTSSTTSPTGAATRRSCSSAWLGRSYSTHGRSGAGAS